MTLLAPLYLLALTSAFILLAIVRETEATIAPRVLSYTIGFAVGAPWVVMAANWTP